MPSLSGAQMRAGRALIRWRAEDLAEQSGVELAAIRRVESNDGPAGLATGEIEAIVHAFDAAGVELIDENGGGAGVRLKYTRLDSRNIARLENEGGIVGEDDVQ